MLKRMPAEDLRFIQIAILEMCNTQNGKTPMEIWESEQLEPLTRKGGYSRWTIMKIVHSLKQVDLLLDWEKTKRNIYFITDLGHEALARFKRSAAELANHPAPYIGEIPVRRKTILP